MAGLRLVERCVNVVSQPQPQPQPQIAGQPLEDSGRLVEFNIGQRGHFRNRPGPFKLVVDRDVRDDHGGGPKWAPGPAAPTAAPWAAAWRWAER
jgi:hypothetical protein